MSGATGPTGSRASYMVTNIASKATEIGGRLYNGHAVDQLQARGIYPSVVENTIKVSNGVLQLNGRTRYYDRVNDITVILDGIIVWTTYYGGK